MQGILRTAQPLVQPLADPQMLYSSFSTYKRLLRFGQLARGE